MPTVQVEHTFNLPVETLWDWLGDFGNMSKWSGREPEACIQEGEGIGALRTITLPDGRKIIDRLEAETERSYTYSIVTSPLPFESYKATMAVEPIDAETSRLIWGSDFTPRGMSDEDCITFTRNMYQMGIRLMEENIAKAA